MGNRHRSRGRRGGSVPRAGRQPGGNAPAGEQATRPPSDPTATPRAAGPEGQPTSDIVAPRTDRSRKSHRGQGERQRASHLAAGEQDANGLGSPEPGANGTTPSSHAQRPAEASAPRRERPRRPAPGPGDSIPQVPITERPAASAPPATPAATNGAKPHGAPPAHSVPARANGLARREDRDANEDDYSDSFWRHGDILQPPVDERTRLAERPEIRGDIASLLDHLRELFARDRAVSSQQIATRCGICYLHYPVADLTYREEEGFYVCAGCAPALGKRRLPMVRRQQKL